MKATCRALALAMMLAPAASFATKVPIPIEGATLNVSIQVQPEFLVNEAGAPAGDSASYDIFVRRTRILVLGDLGPNFTYLIQVDNANFGKYGNFTGRAIVQDAWVGWAPLGLTGGTVLFVDAGILLIPISHHLLESTTNFVTADVQTDAFRIPGNPFQGLRDTGVQIRGWALDKKVGFRGGVYEGYAPIVLAGCDGNKPGSCVAPKRNPALGGFINFDIIGSEEGGWLYGAYKWGKDPILSIGVAGNYQSQAIKNVVGNLTDQKLLAGDVYLNLPMGDNELVFEGTAYGNFNGTGSGNTGLGLSANIGYRIGSIAPYVGYDYFQSTDTCAGLGPAGSGTFSAAQVTTCLAPTAGFAATPDSADSRNFKAGLNYFVAKNTNHVNLEFQVNHGQSSFGPGSITAANAGYVPLTLDPAVPNGPRRAFSANLRNPAYKSLLVHWNFLF